MPIMVAEANTLACVGTRPIYHLSKDVVVSYLIISLHLGTTRPETATRCLRTRLKIKYYQSLPPSTQEYSIHCCLSIKRPTFHPRHRVNSWRHRESALNHPHNRSRDVQQPRFIETPPHRNDKLSSMESGTNAIFVVKNLRSHRDSGDIN